MFGKRGKTAPTEPNRRVRTPKVALWALRIGGGLAIICGGILSFYALFGLAVLNGWPSSIAWALPGSVDILTTTALVVAMAVPRNHPGAPTAHWCAGISLVMTVTCNVEFHALRPAHWSVGHIALVATGAVPAIVVELILIMQMRIGDGATLADTGAPQAPVKKVPSTPKAPPAAELERLPKAPPAIEPPPVVLPQAPVAPAIEAPAGATDPEDAGANGNGGPSANGARAGRTNEAWAELAAPYYRQWAEDHNGTTPTAAMLMEQLRRAGHDVPASSSRARAIRSATEDYLKSTEPESESESEPERVGATS